MRCKIQECGKYQPYTIFIENNLVVETTMSAAKIQAVTLGINLELKNMIKYCTKNNHCVEFKTEKVVLK